MDETTMAQGGTPSDMPSGGGTAPADGGTPPDMPTDSTGAAPMDGGTFGGSTSTSVTYSAAASLTSGGTFTNPILASTNANENALLINTSEPVVIVNPTVMKTGGDTTGDSDSFYGTNSAILATGGGATSIVGGTVNTAAAGANGIFSYGGNGGQNGAAGDGTTVYVNGTTIVTTGDGSGGIMTTGGGVTAAANLNVTTSGRSSAAIRSDRGGGTVLVSGGSYTSQGVGSPAIYSTANIAVENAVLTSTQSEGVCIEGLNSVALTNCILNVSNTTRNGNAQFLDGVILYQSMSGDSSTGTSTFSMTGGTLNNYSGHAFHVTNTNAVINLSGVTINNASGVLLSVCDDGWSGASNVATLNASGQALSGDILVGSDSGLTLNLTNGSTFAGNIGGTIYDASGNLISSTVGAVNVVLDSSSVWYLTGDTYIAGFSGDASNIITNGHNLFVNNQLYGGTTDMATQIATGLTVSDDGLTLNVDSSYTGTGVDLNSLPTVYNVDASTASTYSQGGFTINGNSLDNNLIGSYTNYNIMAGGAGNDTLSAVNGYSDLFIYDGQGNDVITTFTSNLDGDRLILNTPVSYVTRSGSNVIIGTPTGNTLTLQTFGTETNQIYVSADGGNSYFSAQIADAASTITTYMEADYTALSQPGTLYVYSYPVEVFYFDDGEPYTIGGGQQIYLDGSGGKTFVNVYNVDASNSLGDDVIFGDAKANVIIDGAGNNVLWGGADTADDSLVGGAGTDVFFLGKGNGDDVVLNASSADLVNLFDTTLFDIVDTFEANGTISLTFNTGNVVTIQNTENLSATFQLADGGAYRYNRSTGSWQSA